MSSAAPPLAGRPYLRLALLACAAVTAAYGLGLLVPALSPVVAAITCLISIRPTFHGAVQEAWRQVLGTVVGAVVGAGLVTLVGYSPLVIAVSLLAAFAAAHLLRLGEEGAMTIGVTVILVVGGGMSTDAVESRLLGVVVGVLLAMLVSLYVRSGTPHDRALDRVLEQADRLSALLSDIAENLQSRNGRAGIPHDMLRGWLAEADAIARALAQARADAEDAAVGSRWSPLVRRSDAEQVLEQARISEATATTVVGMCRSLLVGDESTVAFPPVLAEPLSNVFAAAADAIAGQADAARENPAEPLDAAAEPARDLVAAQAEALSQIREVDETQPLLLGGALVQHSTVIAEILSGAPTLPASDSDTS